MLGHQPDLSAQAVQRHLADIHAVDENTPPVRFGKPHQQPGQRAFTRAIGADDAYGLAGGDLQADIAHRGCTPGIGEADVLKHDGALGRGQPALARTVRLGPPRETVQQALCRAAGALHFAIHAGQPADGARHQHGVQQQADELGGVECSLLHLAGAQPHQQQKPGRGQEGDAGSQGGLNPQLAGG